MRRRAAVLGLDLGAVLGAYALAFLLRHNLRLAPQDAGHLFRTAPWLLASYAAASYYFGVNRGLRFYASLPEVLDIVKAIGAASLVQGALIVLGADPGFPREVLVSGPILAVFSVAGLNAFARGASHYFQVHLRAQKQRTAVIVGVGDAAELVYQSMRSDQAVDYRVAAFVDDGRRTLGYRLHGVRVRAAGELSAILAAGQVDEVIIAVESHRRGPVLDAVADALPGSAKRPAVVVAPTLSEMLKSPNRLQRRKVKPADLLNRRVISLDAGRIRGSIADKVVLVTGAGGTIGGELARQAARYGPRKLVLLENNATALFYAEAELRAAHPDLPLCAVLGDVRDLSLLNRVFAEEGPQVVFHAAAHKHVPQLEVNVCEGVSNNLVGTYHLAGAADRAGVETFVLISTDKAVRPTSVMGATKRAAEIVVSNFARSSKTRFASVRFGNVLGSSGSVLRIFQEQIEAGQPLTLTHPDMTRWFMTVEEAVGLVLQAASLAKGGETFVLNMGEQVRILDMARRLIRLSGLEPELDVPIRVVGLRPGEKIAEELVEDPLGQEQSEHPEIMVLRSENAQVRELTDRILRLELLSSTEQKDAMLRALTQLVPSFSGNPGHDGARIKPVEDNRHDASIN